MSFLRASRQWLLPLLALAVGASLSVIAARTTERSALRMLRSETELLAEQLGERLRGCVDTRVEMVVAMARERAAGGLADQAAFAARVDALLESFPGYLAINRLDSTGKIVTVHPVAPNRAALGKRVTDTPQAKVGFELARETGSVGVTPPLQLFQGGSGVTFYVPSGEEYLNGVFRAGPLLQSCLGRTELPEHWLSVRDGEAALLEPAEPVDPVEPSVRAATVQLPLRNRSWTLSVIPREDRFAAARGPSRLLLFAGLLLSALLAGAVLVLETVRVRSRQAERRSRAEITRLAAVVEAAQDYIGITGLDGQVLYLNKTARQIIGVSPEQITGGYSVDRLVAPEDAGPLTAHLAKVREAGFAQDELQLIHRPSGQRIPIEFQSFHIHSEQGEVIARATVGRDLRERRRLEAQLSQAQKMEALGRLAGGVAHDFNNVLTVILSNAELIKAGKLPAAELAEGIEAAADRAVGLARQLLALGRGQPTQLETVELGALVEGLQPMFARLIRSDVPLELKVAEGAFVRGSPVQLEQILVNLVMNAADAMPRGGQIGVQVRVDGASGQVMLEVSDTGLGMTTDTASRIFEPFFTTKEAGKGTGLGLTTVYAHVQRMQGKIAVDSAPGKGTRFTVTLPLVPAPAARSEKECPRPPSPASPGASVLLVEDEPEVRTSLARMLRSHGYRVEEADSSQAAIALLERNPRCAEVVVSDVVMPGGGARELLAWRAAHHAHLPIVLASGHAGTLLDDIDLEASGIALLHKPFGKAQLIASIQRAIEARGREPPS